MATVFFSSELQKLTGEESLGVTPGAIRDVIAQVVAHYPKIDQERLSEMAVAIDGEIIHTPLLENVTEGSEVHFLYRISGG